MEGASRRVRAQGRDPDGAEETVKVDDPRYLSHLKVGDDLVVTVRQAIAISLDKRVKHQLSPLSRGKELLKASARPVPVGSWGFSNVTV